MPADTRDDRLDALESRLGGFQKEVRAEFASVRAELRAGDEGLRREILDSKQSLQEELRREILDSKQSLQEELRREIRESEGETRRLMREGDEETRSLMRALHEDVIDRIKTLGEAR